MRVAYGKTSKRTVQPQVTSQVWVSRLNPGAKLGTVLAFGLSTLFFPTPMLGALLMCLLALVAVTSGLIRDFVKVIVGFGVPITLMLMFIQGCYGAHNTTIVADLGFAKLGREGLLYAVDTVVTLLVFLGGCWLLNMTTPIGELVCDLTDRGLSPKISYLLLASLNVVPQLKRRMATIREAQSSRGLSVEGGLIARLRATVPLLGPVVMSSLTDAEERSMTLETHGFGLSGSTHTSYVDVHHCNADRLLVYLSAASLVLSLACRIASMLGLAMPGMMML